MRYPVWQQNWFPVEAPGYADFQVAKTAYRSHYYTPGVRSAWLKHLKEKDYEYKEVDDVFPVFELSPKKLQEMWVRFKATHAPASPAVPFALRAAWYSYLRDAEEVREMAGLVEQVKPDEAAADDKKSGDNADVVAQTVKYLSLIHI